MTWISFLRLVMGSSFLLKGAELYVHRKDLLPWEERPTPWQVSPCWYLRARLGLFVLKNQYMASKPKCKRRCYFSRALSIPVPFYVTSMRACGMLFNSSLPWKTPEGPCERSGQEHLHQWQPRTFLQTKGKLAAAPGSLGWLKLPREAVKPTRDPLCHSMKPQTLSSHLRIRQN